MRAVARLARWLGPWTAEGSRPLGVRRTRVRLPRFDAWVYHPLRRARAAILVVPGLHYLGPADPRLDRFLAILADAGTLALCPFLPELRALRVGPAVVEQAREAFDALLALPDLPRSARPGVLSISFGSYPAIHLSSRPEVGALVLFGGYASFEDAIRFSLEGDPGRPHDPLNQPVAFLALLDHLEGRPDDAEPLRRAWTTYVRCTWGRPAMKERAHHEPLAHEIARRLAPSQRELFLIGAGVAPGGKERALAALERGRASLAHLDVREACSRVRAKVTIVHGRDDDVIPHTHAPLLAGAMPREAAPRLLLTGLYAHTGHGRPSPAELVDEARTMHAILDGVAACGAYR